VGVKVLSILCFRCVLNSGLMCDCDFYAASLKTNLFCFHVSICYADNGLGNTVKLANYLSILLMPGSNENTWSFF
jgi:hypothetical protein